MKTQNSHKFFKKKNYKKTKKQTLVYPCSVGNSYNFFVLLG